MNFMMSIDQKKVYFSLISATSPNGAELDMLAAGKIEHVDQIQYYEAFLDFLDACKGSSNDIEFRCEYYCFGEENAIEEEADPSFLLQIAGNWWIYENDPQMHLLETYSFNG